MTDLPEASEPSPNSASLDTTVTPERDVPLTVEAILKHIHRLSPRDQARLWSLAPRPIVQRKAANEEMKRGLWNAVEGSIRRCMDEAFEEISGRMEYEFGDRIAAHWFKGHEAANLLRHLLVAQRALFDVEIARLRGLLRALPGLTFLPKAGAIDKACKTLGVPRPRHGQIDLDGARRAMRTLVAQLHPDRNGGQRLHEEQFREVIEAYAAIQSFVEKNRVRSNKAST
jgi:hypothetical protein